MFCNFLFYAFLVDLFQLQSTQATNAEHLRSVNDMGIVLVALAEGKVQLVHSFYNVSAHINL